MEEQQLFFPTTFMFCGFCSSSLRMPKQNSTNKKMQRPLPPETKVIILIVIMVLLILVILLLPLLLLL